MQHVLLLPPIAMQTLCSGTDAPAIALRLVRKELQPALAESGLELSIAHTMSCENETQQGSRHGPDAGVRGP